MIIQQEIIWSINYMKKDMNEKEILENNNLETDSSYGTATIPSLFLKVVLPSIIAMLITGIQGVIDGLFLGNYMGDSAMASANIAAPFLQILMGITMVISIGGTAFIGRSLGHNDLRKAQDIFKSCFVAISVSSIFIILSTGFFSDQFAVLFGASDTLLQGSSDYIRVIGIFSPVVMFYVLFAFTNRVIGKPHLLLIASMACVVTNITLNYVFIALLNLGMTGAGLATGLSYTFGFLINIRPIFSKKNDVNIYTGKFKWNLLGELLYNGSSEGITSISTAVTIWVFNLTFMYYYGDSGVASFTIVNYISQFTTTLLFGMADGITPILAYHYGANLRLRIVEIMKISMCANFLVGAGIYLIIQLAGETLIGFFADGNSALISLTYTGAKIYALCFLLSGFNILVSANFTAKGDALKSVLVSSSRGLIFILLGIFTLPHFFGVTGVWFVLPFAEMITMVISLYLLFRQNTGAGH